MTMTTVLVGDTGGAEKTEPASVHVTRRSLQYLHTLTIALGFTWTAPPTNTVHSNYYNTELHTSRKWHCSAVVISCDVGVDPVISGVDDSNHILHCTVTLTPAYHECGVDSIICQ